MAKRMLVVDDDRAIAHLAGVWLKDAGFETELAFDGPSALSAAGQRKPDGILLDLRMPRMDGLAVQNQLRRDTELSAIPVIFLSANIQESARREALAGGAAGFLTKPYSHDELIEAVQRAVA